MLFMFCWLPIILEGGMLYQLLIWLLEFPVCPWHLYPRSTQIQFWLCIWFQLFLPEQVSIFYIESLFWVTQNFWPYLVWWEDIFYSLVIFWLYYKDIYRKTNNLFILSYFFTGFSLVYLMTSELYPTNLRSQAVGFASTISRVFCLCAPFLGHIAKIWEPAPMVLIG